MALKFDNTVNLNHLGSLLVIAGACLAGFYSQGSRISILEDRDARAQLVAQDQKSEAKETLKEIKGDIKGLQASVNAIGIAIAGGRPSSVTVNSDSRK